MNQANGNKVLGVVRSLVNAKGLQLVCKIAVLCTAHACSFVWQ